MKAVQLNDNIRLVTMSDNEGDFGILINHVGNRVLSTFEWADEEELKAGIEYYTT